MRFPWEKTKVGVGFFVPTLNVEKTRKQGLQAAYTLRFRDTPHAEIGVYKGRLGVMFYRGYLSLEKRERS